VAIIRGRIKAISVSSKKGVRKKNVGEAELKADFGIAGDIHAGPGLRQVSLLATESIDAMATDGLMLSPGDFAENITTEGMDVRQLHAGDRLILGETAEIEITQIGKKCHGRCEIFRQAGDCIMPREGAFARVVKSGIIKTGDEIRELDDESGNPDDK
jgi:molybdopterin adenylyltransferase